MEKISNKFENEPQIRAVRINTNYEGKVLVYDGGNANVEHYKEVMTSKEDGVIEASTEGMQTPNGFLPKWKDRKEGSLIVNEINIADAGGDDYYITGPLTDIKEWIEKNIKGEIDYKIE
jgi:hypothetical protein